MSEDYVLWNFEDVDDALVPKDLEGYGGAAQKYQLLTGGVWEANGSEPLEFTADPEFPDETMLIDTFGNSESVFPVSPKLRGFIAAKAIPQVDFIPVRMLDHDRQFLAEYFLLHPLDPVDCIDVEASTLRVNRLNPDNYNRVKKLVLDESRIPKERQLFRIRGLYTALAVSKSLAEEITTAGFTGIMWQDIGEFRF